MVHFRRSRRAGVGVVVPALVHPPVLRDQARPLAIDFVRCRRGITCPSLELCIAVFVLLASVACCFEDFRTTSVVICRGLGLVTAGIRNGPDIYVVREV